RRWRRGIRGGSSARAISLCSWTDSSSIGDSASGYPDKFVMIDDTPDDVLVALAPFGAQAAVGWWAPPDAAFYLLLYVVCFGLEVVEPGNEWQARHGFRQAPLFGGDQPIFKALRE